MLHSDHKVIGEKYNLFFFDKNIPGQVLFMPKGNYMFAKLQNIIRSLMLRNNYQEIKSGSFGTTQIWHVTKHTSKYMENIFQLNNKIFIETNELSFTYYYCTKNL